MISAWPPLTQESRADLSTVQTETPSSRFRGCEKVLQSGAREIIIESDVKSKGGKLFYGDSNKGYYHW